ncbi:MAG: methionine--tRNA ligase [Thermoflexales bacterium]|nr:methionine--tRNA ligase [Thermoflexales bacterium]MDW8350422.1 methionine--tRNA ligase [Anaerolineae bacterium]
MENILVCVAWPYANGDLHVGHVAGAYLPADIFARYHRLKGNRVVMVSGSDAHGTPIVVRADKEGKTPREVFEYYHGRFLETQRLLGISYDLFTHTDTENHHAISRQMFRRLLENGYLFKATQKQLYSERQGKFLPDRLVEGTCPICGYDKARGDQCDSCGHLLDGTQLINPHSRAHPDDKLTIRESEHYFFNLPALREPILAYLADKDGYWRSTVLEFSRRYAEEMEPRAFTRDLTWGIPIPVEGAEGKCIYVWYEALLGYLSATIEWAQVSGQPDAWKEFWYRADGVRIYNFIGKDNILFHTVLWPAALIGMQRLGEPWDGLDRGADLKFNLPYDVPANQYLNLGGQKFSKSLGVSLDAIDLAQKYGADALRFYLTLIMPEARDSDWSWSDFAQRNNSELLAKWGNLIQRTLSQIWRNFEGRIPQPGELTEADQALIAKVEAGFDSVGEKLNAVRLRDALNEALDLATATNQYLDFEAPWKTIKTDKARAGTQLYVAARVVDSLTVLFAPFTPGLSERARAQLGYADPLFGEQYIETLHESTRSHDVLRYDARRARGRWAPSQLPPGQPLGGEPKGLVSKIELADEA